MCWSNVQCLIFQNFDRARDVRLRRQPRRRRSQTRTQSRWPNTSLSCTGAQKISKKRTTLASKTIRKRSRLSLPAITPRQAQVGGHLIRSDLSTATTAATRWTAAAAAFLLPPSSRPRLPKRPNLPPYRILNLNNRWVAWHLFYNDGCLEYCFDVISFHLFMSSSRVLFYSFQHIFLSFVARRYVGATATFFLSFFLAVTMYIDK